VLLRNEGPPWTRRGTGEVIPHGGTLVATAQEVDRFRRRGMLGKEFVELEPAPRGAYGPSAPVVQDAPSPVPAAPPAATASVDSPPIWSLMMEPALYLKLYPRGPNAELARAVLAAKEG
jgi:hypothetical protein